MFLKENHDGGINARRCTVRKSQRDYTMKAETSLPTVSLEAMILSCTIDGKEGRYIAVTNIPGAFLLANMEQDVQMLLDGTIAELIVKLEPRLYRKYIWKNKYDNPCYTSS